MFNVTTKYDTIDVDGEKVRKKVFMIRGDEAYARTTDTVLTVSTPSLGNVKGLRVNLTATIHRNVGASTVVFYDGDEVLDMMDIGDGVSSVMLTNVYLSYVVEHQLYAVFKGNSSCLSSKSKKVSVQANLPNSLNTTIAFNSPPTQLATGSSTTLSLTAKVNNVNVPNGTELLIYKDDNYIDTILTSSGNASITLTGMTRGLHTVRATIEDSDSINGATTEIDIAVGYDIAFTTVPPVFVNGMDNTVKVTVTDYYNSPVSGASVSLTGKSATTTDSKGVATFTYTTMTDEQTLTATCNGDTSTQTVRSFTPTSISITPSRTVCGYGSNVQLSAVINGTGYKEYKYIPITWNIAGRPQYTEYPSYPYTNYTSSYTSNGKGTVRIQASCGVVTGYVDIQNYIMYYTPTQEVNFDYNVTNPNGNPQYSDTSTGFMIANSNTTLTLNTREEGGTLEFKVVSVGNNTTTYLLGTTNVVIPLSTPLKANDNVKLVADGTDLKLYVNNTHITTQSCTNIGKWLIYMLDTQPNITVNGTTSTSSLKITNLKVYK